MIDPPGPYRIRDLAEMGAQVLSNPELLAILLRVGTPGENAVQIGQRMLRELNGLNGIHRATFEDLCGMHGVGPAKAAQIKAAIELGRRLGLESPEERLTINSPKSAADLVMYEMTHVDHLYKGSLNSSMVRVGELFKSAIRRNSASILLMHNHRAETPLPTQRTPT